MEELELKKERLLFLKSRIVGEIEKFKNLLNTLKKEKEKIYSEVGHNEEFPIEVKVMPSEKNTLENDIIQHIEDLERIKNQIDSKIRKLNLEIELRKKLSKKYGNTIKIKKSSFGGFEIELANDTTNYIYSQVKAGKKILEEMKKILEEKEK